MQKKTSEIKEVIWIDKKVFNDENQGYKKKLEESYGLKVHEYDNAEKGIEAIKKRKFILQFLLLQVEVFIQNFIDFLKVLLPILKICLFK